MAYNVTFTGTTSPGNAVVGPAGADLAGTGPAQVDDTLVYVPLDPGTRVYDSRTADGPLRAGDSRTVDLATAAPEGASAVVYTITEFDTVGSGHLSVGLPGQPKPPTSAINWYASGQRLANGTTLAIRDGKMTTFNGSGATQYIVDIAGYYYRSFHYRLSP